jgi:hypothetical protein
MSFKKWFFIPVLFLGTIVSVPGCKPDTTPDPIIPDPIPGGITLSYGDSIFYLRAQANDSLIFPRPTGKTGTFFSYPLDLAINATTGAINLNESETGMRYKVMFVPTGTRDTFSTKIVISGISYQDHYHIQSLNDSLSRPFYNANFNQYTLPAGCSFDVGGSARAEGLAIDPATGVINLNQSIRNGYFGHYPARDRDQKNTNIYYTIPDRSGGALNKLKVRFYFYNNMSTVESDLLQLLSDRSDMFFRMAQNIFTFPSGNARVAVAQRPRPPCVVILGQR